MADGVLTRHRARVLALAATVLCCGIGAVASPRAAATVTRPAGAIASPDFVRSALARFNHYRVMAKLPPVTEDKAGDAAAAAHARYLVENKIIGGDAVFENAELSIYPRAEAWHNEKSGTGWYTNSGAAAGWDGVVLSSDDPNFTARELIDRLFSIPFEVVGLLNPQLFRVAGGKFCGDGRCVAVFVPHYGLPVKVHQKLYKGAQAFMWNTRLGVPLSWGRLRTPIEFPPDRSTTTITSYSARDFYNPLLSCTGYVQPTGAPIMIQFGAKRHGGSPRITNRSLTRDGTEIENCLVSGYTYKIPKPSPASASKPTGAAPSAKVKERNEKIVPRFIGRFLRFLGAAVIIPRKPLKPGLYKVSVTAGNKTYDWSFKVASPAAAPAPKNARVWLSGN